MKKQAISVAITAYNEEENIERLILSIFKQKLKNTTLSEVIVIADGSTDGTPRKVKDLQKQFIKLSLRNHKKNMGKLYRLNEVFKKNKTDILVLLDGDIALVGDMFLQNLVEQLVKNKKRQIVAAHSELIMPEGLPGKVVASSFLTWDYIRVSVPHFDSIHNFSSQATAYRGSFVKKLHIPRKAFEERIYIYLMAKKESQEGFGYAQDAKYKFLPISTIKDFILLTKRPFGRRQTAIDTLFGFPTETLLIIPLKYKIKGLLHSFVEFPILTITGVIFNFILPKIVLLKKSNDSALWERSASTKRRIEV